MLHQKKDVEQELWKDPEHKYHEIHEELSRLKREDKTVEEALFQVVHHKEAHIQFSDNGAITKRHAFNKFFGLFKFGKNKG